MKKILTLALVLTIILLNFGCASLAVKGCSICMVESKEKIDEKNLEDFEATFETYGDYEICVHDGKYCSVVNYLNETPQDVLHIPNEIEGYVVDNLFTKFLWTEALMMAPSNQYCFYTFNGQKVVFLKRQLFDEDHYSGWHFEVIEGQIKVNVGRVVYTPNQLRDYEIGEVSISMYFEGTEKMFIPSVSDYVYYSLTSSKSYGEDVTFYVTDELFHWLRLYGIETNDFKDAMNATYRLEKVYEDSDVKGPVTQIANTCFMYNYCGAPNGGYYFINEYERGGLIEEPEQLFRRGAFFTGWYKEPECINPWNFETDTLPEAEYDENGELVFVETILYAGWNKI